MPGNVFYCLEESKNNIPDSVTYKDKECIANTTF